MPSGPAVAAAVGDTSHAAHSLLRFAATYRLLCFFKPLLTVDSATTPELRAISDVDELLSFSDKLPTFCMGPVSMRECYRRLHSWEIRRVYPLVEGRLFLIPLLFVSVWLIVPCTFQGFQHILEHEQPMSMYYFSHNYTV